MKAANPRAEPQRDCGCRGGRSRDGRRVDRGCRGGRSRDGRCLRSRWRSRRVGRSRRRSRSTGLISHSQAGLRARRDGYGPLVGLGRAAGWPSVNKQLVQDSFRLVGLHAVPFDNETMVESDEHRT